MRPFGRVAQLTRAELECLVVDFAGTSPGCESADDDEEVVLAIDKQLEITRSAYGLTGRQVSKVRA